MLDRKSLLKYKEFLKSFKDCLELQLLPTLEQKVCGDKGNLEIQVPLDRDGIFNPIIFPKHKSIIDEVDEYSDKIMIVLLKCVKSNS